MKDLFTIGEVSRLFQMNIRTLRYYDEIGLLKPEYVDPETGYRYYSTRQFERINTIRYMRALDMPLPAGTYITVRFRGTHRESAGYYVRLLDELSRGGYAVAGDSVEITLIDSGITSQPAGGFILFCRKEHSVSGQEL